MRLVATFALVLLAAAAAAQGFPPDPGASARSFLELFLAKDPRLSDLYDATMKASFPNAKAFAVADQLAAAGGRFVAFGEARTATVDAYLSVVMPGTYERLEVDFKVVYDKDGKVAGFFALDARLPAGTWLPPGYATPSKFTEEDAVVDAGGWPLPATLAIPKGKGPFPAVVLVHGSGPNDRDESVGPTRVFKDLAWGLATRGVATLRYEKRTREHGLRFAREMDRYGVREETVDDALAALALLARDPRIDPRRITLAGHSLGAMLAPMVAREAAARKLPGPAGLALLAPPARPLEDVTLGQVRYLAGLDGSVSAEEKGVIAELEAAVARVKKLGSSSPAPEELPLGLPAAYWRSLAGYDPVAVAKGLGLPLLVLHGERDYQVPAADAALWKAGLAGTRDATLRVLPRLNHLFVAGTGTPSPAEYGVAGHVDESALKALADFALKVRR